MALLHEIKEFASWTRASSEKKLKPEQLAVLHNNMVAEGQAEALEQAAKLLDWQETVIDPIEHMYGL